MRFMSTIPKKHLWTWIAATLLASLLGAAVLAGWMRYSTAILLDMAAAGLSWCF